MKQEKERLTGREFVAAVGNILFSWYKTQFIIENDIIREREGDIIKPGW